MPSEGGSIYRLNRELTMRFQPTPAFVDELPQRFFDAQDREITADQSNEQTLWYFNIVFCEHTPAIHHNHLMSILLCSGCDVMLDPAYLPMGAC